MTKRRVLAVLVALAMLIGGLPVSGLEANAAQKHCKNSDDCIVCTIAEMINDLPDAEDIDVYNAAAVVEQIHAIDRIKGKLSDDEYEEMIKLVEAGNDGSGYGVDVPTRYLDAVMAVNNLNAGGSLYAQKKYSVGDNELDWNKTDATLKIECIDKNTNFEPLKVTLANATDSYLGAIGAYNENADGWTNTYILPAGTYKITETRYNAVTVDGDKLTTTATYDVDGTETTDYAIVEVKAGEESSVSVLNTYGPSANIKAVASQEDGVDSDGNTKYKHNPLTGAEIDIIDPKTGDVIKKDLSLDPSGATVNLLTPNKLYAIKVTKVPDGYYYMDHDVDMHFWVEEGENGESITRTDVVGAEEKNTALIRFKKIDQFVIWLKDKATIQYGESPTNVLDYGKSTLNGEEIPDDTRRLLGTAAFVFNFNGSLMYPSEVGEYEVTVDERGNSIENAFTFNGKCKLTIVPKVIKKDDVIVSVDKNVDEKAPAKSLNVEFKEGTIKVKGVDRDGKLIYEDVKAVVDAKVINKDGKQYIEYKIKGLSGDDAGNYVIEGDAIEGIIAVENNESMTNTASVTNTGDDFDLLLMMTIMLITLATMTGVAYVGRRRTQ